MPTTKYDAVIVGAGFAGLYTLQRLRQQGITVRVFEAGTDVGGTWYWNRYPGARCDSESIYYMFSDRLSTEILQEWNWSERFAAQPEILRYLQFVADRLNLRPDIQFDTRIVTARYDQIHQCWQIETEHGEQVQATFFITAVGCLSVANQPHIAGLDAFQGQCYHTGNWPHTPVDFTGQHVAVIGTGATGVQIVPEIAEQVEHLYVFQRTANYDIPGRNRPLAEQERQAVKAAYPELWQKMRHSNGGFPHVALDQSALAVTDAERQRVYQEAWASGGFQFFMATFNDYSSNLQANATLAEFIRSQIRTIVHDPAVAESLAPNDHPFGTKRPPLEHGYYAAFNRSNVTLVDLRHTPIETITPTGIRTPAAEYPVDAIIFATGFDAMTGGLFKLNITGCAGVTLQQKWADRPTTYLGLTTSGFPNLFMITGPQSPSVFTNMPVAIEQHAEWISDCIQYLRDHNLRSIEAQPEAEERWMQHATELAEASMLLKTASWWVGANVPGKPRLVYPYVGGLGSYRDICDQVAEHGYQGFMLQS